VLSAALARDAPMMRAFDGRLRELGYVDGRTIVVKFRNAEGQLDQLDRLAAELVALDPAVIVAPGPEAVLRAFRTRTSTIPIVAVANDYDPVASGYVEDYAEPGENVTGVAIRRVEINRKRLELLKETLPSVTTVALLADGFAENLVPHAEAAAKALGLSLEIYRFDRPPYDIEATLAVAAPEVGAVMTLASPIFFRQRHDLFAAAARHRLPVFYGVTLGTADGALMGYGASFPAAYARAADYVDKILKGADPGKLPIEQSDRFELVVNLKTAADLGIPIPRSILLRADEVIE
jgi:putative ABC transport system substrate-binding protein